MEEVKSLVSTVCPFTGGRRREKEDGSRGGVKRESRATPPRVSPSIGSSLWRC